MTDNRTTELLPCPFCGGEAEIHPSNDWDVKFTGSTYFAWCDKCETRGDYYNTEAEAIAAWNTRAERTCRMELTDLNSGSAYRDVWLCGECGGQVEQHTFLGKSDKPNYCPNCGRKVVSR